MTLMEQLKVYAHDRELPYVWRRYKIPYEDDITVSVSENAKVCTVTILNSNSEIKGEFTYYWNGTVDINIPRVKDIANAVEIINLFKTFLTDVKKSVVPNPKKS